MSVQSPCEITFTPDGDDAVVLVAVGDWLTAPPRWSVEQELYETTGVMSGNAYFQPLGGAVMTLNFETETDYETHAAALNAFSIPEMIGGVNLLEVGGELTITGGGMVATSATAVVTSIIPKLPSGAVSSVLRAFSIRAALPTAG